MENKPGRLQEMLRILKENSIDLRALSVDDTGDYGIVRLVLSDTEKGLEALRQGEFTAHATEVLKATIPDTPGGLLETVIAPLAEAGINVEYLYAFERSQQNATVIVKVSDVDRAARVIGQ